MRQGYVVLTLAILLLACGGPRTVSAGDADEEAVRRTVDGYAETWNRHDMDALGALFAPNADFVQVNGVWWKGRQTIQTNIAFLHGTVPQNVVGVTLPANTYGVFKASTYRFDRVDVRFVRHDVAIAHIAWTQLGDPRFKEPRGGVLTFVVSRDGDRWLLNAAQNTARP